MDFAEKSAARKAASNIFVDIGCGGLSGLAHGITCGINDLTFSVSGTPSLIAVTTGKESCGAKLTKLAEPLSSAHIKFAALSINAVEPNPQLIELCERTAGKHYFVSTKPPNEASIMKDLKHYLETP